LKELGVKQVALEALFQFAGPKNMPREAVGALAREIKKAAESKKISDLIANKLALKAIFISGEQLDQKMAQSKKESEELISFVK
jgi:tripartite-type tricarboxylate transporter receptor subunit TctC